MISNQYYCIDDIKSILSYQWYRINIIVLIVLNQYYRIDDIESILLYRWYRINVIILICININIDWYNIDDGIDINIISINIISMMISSINDIIDIIRSILILYYINRPMISIHQYQYYRIDIISMISNCININIISYQWYHHWYYWLIDIIFNDIIDINILIMILINP